MTRDLPYHELIQPLSELIRRFLEGNLDYVGFQRLFQPALKSYERSIDDRAYWPLDAIADIPKHCKSSLHDYCRQALDRLPKEALDRSTRFWVESNLIVDDNRYTYFSFYNGDDQSRFGTEAVFYSTHIDQNSFLLSSLNGTIGRPTFTYTALLTSLRDVGGNELASWVYGTEPDNALAVIENIWSLGDAYNEPEQLRRIERKPAAEGGRSCLMLLPKSKQWMLLNDYNYDRFTICLHGDRQFILDVASRIKAQPEWD